MGGDTLSKAKIGEVSCEALPDELQHILLNRENLVNDADPPIEHDHDVFEVSTYPEICVTLSARRFKCFQFGRNEVGRSNDTYLDAIPE